MRASRLLALCLLAALGAASCDDLGGSLALANEPGLGVAAMMAAPKAAPEAAAAPGEAQEETGEGGEEIAAAAEGEEREGLDDAGASGGQGERLSLDPQELAALDAPYTELIRRFRQPRQPGSVGTTLRGRLHGAAALEVSGEHHAILPECVERETRFGTPDLVSLLLRAAEITHTTHGGPRLMIGNLSFEGGGNIPWSRSHNSGLDADLAFFVLKDGQPEEAPTLMRFGGRLHDLDELGYTFDVPRSWTLIKSLLTHPTVEVQWLFIARPLRRAVLEHARAQGEAPAGHERPEVREPAACTLERLANHAPPGERWDRHATPEQLRAQRERWAAWWAERADRSRDDLLLAGFQRVQPAIKRLDADAIGHLIHLTERRDVIGYNADHALRQLTGRWAPREATAEQRHTHWSHASAEAADE